MSMFSIYTHSYEVDGLHIASSKVLLSLQIFAHINTQCWLKQSINH